MDVSDASYYNTYSMKKKELKVTKWGTPKKPKKNPNA
jgi:hypothetical protein